MILAATLIRVVHVYGHLSRIEYTTVLVLMHDLGGSHI